MTRTIQERFALSMCYAELSRKNMPLDVYFSEVKRTWRRFIPEALDLIARLESNDLKITDKQTEKSLS